MERKIVLIQAAETRLAMPRPENPIQLAVIGAAHGTRGEVRVKTFTGDPLAITEYGLLYDEQGKSYEVLERLSWSCGSRASMTATPPRR
jgi:16S rRNA processing protein RimM